MSEYQYVAFQAVDGPLNDKQLEFAQQQSSRAEVSRWSLSVEYHYSSFRGDVDGLLRQGYDVYLQITNYEKKRGRSSLIWILEESMLDFAYGSSHSHLSRSSLFSRTQLSLGKVAIV